MLLIVSAIFHIGLKVPECKASAFISVIAELLSQFK